MMSPRDRSFGLRRVVFGIGVGLILGVGIPRVFAGPATSTGEWQSGELLTAEKLNQRFLELRTAIDNLQDPICPTGYVQDSSQTQFVLCRKNGRDEVVKVGTGNAAFFIDRFEASVWQNPDGSGTRYGMRESTGFPSSFPDNGQYNEAAYALSIPNVLPSELVTWFQADAACEASGKRLPTGNEWLRAARGTKDGGVDTGASGNCVTAASSPRATGNRPGCQSRWGAQDMIGNLWEWTADWQASLGTTADQFGREHYWLHDAYQRDAVYNVLSLAHDGTELNGVPAAALRGGGYLDKTEAGVFAITYNDAPSAKFESYGFRCVIPR